MKKTIFTLIAFCSFLSFSQTHFSENFDSGLPGTWSSFIGTNGLGTVENWEITSPGLVSDSCMIVRYENAGGVTEDWLVTPQITLGAANNRLKFYLAQSFSSDYGSSFDVRVSTTSQTVDSTFTTIQTWNEADVSPSSTWLLQLVDLSAYNGQSIYIAFVMKQDDGDTWFMDSVVVETPSCLVSTNLNATNITDSSAALEWSGTGVNYQIAYFPNITAPNPVYVIANDSTYNLTGLVSNARVSYYVREICSPGDTGYWSDVYRFTTTCTPNTVLPYTQNFDTDTSASLPCDWTYEDNNGDGIRWGLASSTSAKSGDNILYITYNDTTIMNDWVFSPEFNLTGGSTYDVNFSYRTSIGITFEDFFMTYGNAQNSAAHTDTIDTFYFINTIGIWRDTSYSFTPSTTGNYSIGFKGISAADQNYIMIDDFSLDLSPTTLVNKKELLDINVYPNPNNGLFTISNKSGKMVNVLITDVNGRVIHEINNLVASKNIDLSYVNKGIYFTTIVSEKALTTKKIIIK